MINSQSETYTKVYFAVMAIEESAKRQDVTGQEMYFRLKAQDLIRQRLFRHYELLHTQSLDWVVDDTIETLQNWEKESKEGEI
jgi:hypothetical protein